MVGYLSAHCSVDGIQRCETDGNHYYAGITNHTKLLHNGKKHEIRGYVDKQRGGADNDVLGIYDYSHYFCVKEFKFFIEGSYVGGLKDEEKRTEYSGHMEHGRYVPW